MPERRKCELIEIAERGISALLQELERASGCDVDGICVAIVNGQPNSDACSGPQGRCVRISLRVSALAWGKQ